MSTLGGISPAAPSLPHPPLTPTAERSGAAAPGAQAGGAFQEAITLIPGRSYAQMTRSGTGPVAQPVFKIGPVV